MKVVSSLSDVNLNQPSVVSIGNFDGLHLGHQAAIRNVIEKARDLKVRPAAMTFAPHPVRFLAPARPLRLISTLPQKLRLMESAGIELVFLATFDHAFSQLPPEKFIQQYLVGALRARAVCVGTNFNFGYRGAGTAETLLRWTDKFEVIIVPPVSVRGTRVSSSHIRELVAAGKVSKACRMMERWFEIEGRIVSGAGRGRSVTVPTLNLLPENELIPEMGVYVSRMSIDRGSFLDSITNVGVRPTFGENELTIETFVLNGAIPPQAISARLQFIKRLRSERCFESAEALRAQIDLDIQRARRFFRLLDH